MRLLVISDSHKKSGVIDSIIGREVQAKHIFFLGDVIDDIEDMPYLYPDRKFYIVSGNCDGFSSYQSFGIANIGGHGIFYTHGHKFGVKGGVGTLAETARKNGCDIALYGHTHIADIKYENGVHIVNPGSCSCSRSGFESYAVIDIIEGGILPAIKRA